MDCSTPTDFFGLAGSEFRAVDGVLCDRTCPLDGLVWVLKTCIWKGETLALLLDWSEPEFICGYW